MEGRNDADDGAQEPHEGSRRGEGSQKGDASFQAPWSLLGLPSISLPSGVSEAGLPFATQLVARHLDEPTLLGAARWVETVLDFTARPPENW